EEIGAAFSIRNASNSIAVGSIFGKRGNGVLNQSTNLTINQTNHFFRPLGASLGATLGAGQSVTATASAPRVTGVYRGENSVIGELFSADGKITAPAPVFGGTELTYREFFDSSAYM